MGPMVEKLKINSSIVIPPVAVIGLGVSGEAAFQLLMAAGVPRNQIATYDKKQAADFQDEKALLDQFRPRTLVVSPGVPLSSSWILEFKKAGGRITSELELAFSLLTSEKVIAVTGSVGKSTTVSILGAGAQSFAPDSFVGGNLGTPLAQYSKGLLNGQKPCSWIILELSSYQLENFSNLRADWSSIVSLTPNHMERYPDLDSYYRSKWFLLERTTGTAVLNGRGGDLSTWSKGRASACPMIFTDRDDATLVPLKLKDAKLMGGHNQDNLAVAVRIALLAGWPSSSIEAMKSFRGLAHRLENLGTKNGVTFVNDSKATTIESVRTAVQSLLNPNGSSHIHLLLGGKDKNLPWEDLRSLSDEGNIRFYFFGECGALAQQKSGLVGDVFQTLEAAAKASVAAAKADDLILLSPGGTSLDAFKNFEARGNAFRDFFHSI